jgi:putative nucleotidyltransferase-like protein
MAPAAAATGRRKGRFAHRDGWNSLDMDDQQHPHEREWRGTLPEVDEQTFLAVLSDAIRVAGGTGLPHAFMGGIASTALGRPRWTHDIDLCVRREDARAMLRAFADAGYATEETDQTWLYKATRDGVLVDVIFESTGGIVLDDEMLSRVRQGTFEHLQLTVLGPEDLLVIKAIVHREHRQRHWFDALALVETGELDWPYLLRRAAPGPRRVASLLLYAQTDGLQVPDWVIESLLEQAREQETGAGVPEEYLVAHAGEALASDPRTAELELDVTVDDREVVVTGTVATPERQAAVADVVAKALPGREVRNLTSVEDETAEPFVETLP